MSRPTRMQRLSRALTMKPEAERDDRSYRTFLAPKQGGPQRALTLPILPPSRPTKQEPIPEAPPITTKQATFCCECNESKEVWRCLQCDDSFCDECWEKQRPHKPGKVGVDGRPHEKVDEAVLSLLKEIFHQPTQAEQHELHKSDFNTAWFGVDKKDEESFLYCSSRLSELLQDSQAERHPNRFPHLVSFVGQTGAGKSTVIKMLMHREKARAERQKSEIANDDLCPVPGLIGDNLPTTGDVHLYADPGTYYEQRPMLYADSEGMTGGESAPRGLISQIKMKGKRKPRFLVKGKIYRRLLWASDASTQSREFAVTSLFPKILYTFSDVVVFVLREVRTFQTEVLQLLVQWAATSINQSINQPIRPHIIVVLNATDVNIDEKQWDPAVATSGLLDDYEASVNQVPAIRDLIKDLPKGQAKSIKTTKDLLEYFYLSVTVLRIPSKGRYMRMDEQVGKLYHIITEKCGSSYDFKREARMLLDTERLPRYVNAAYDHFSRRLDEPFDFAKEARRHIPLPQDLSGHLLNLFLFMYDQPEIWNSSVEMLFDKLARPIASCLMLAAMRGNTQGTYSSLLEHAYKDPLSSAFYEFNAKWLRCSFQQDGHRCINTQSMHEKGHQSQKGKILSRGEYQRTFEPNVFLDKWISKIDRNIKDLAKRLYEGKGEERDRIPMIHEDVMEQFYKQFRSGATFKSHLTCVCCVGKIPEHVLPCGHIICKACVQCFGRRKGQGLFELHYCPLHPNNGWTHPVSIRFKPAEAGVRVLCLDGGGVRGIIELVILREIERALGNHIPIQNFFDLIVGTSTGGIIALGLGVKNWSVSECIDHFHNLCQQAFTSRAPRLFKTITAMSGKGVYKTKTLENALQSAFDKKTLLYGGIRPGNSPPIRVAVTSTLASEDRPAILSNYNTEGRPESLPYIFIRPQDPSHEFKVWEAARATSAAPPYFKPFIHTQTMSAYTDGAIHHHCPVLIADQERQLLWEDVSDWSPDIVLSIGSGVEITQEQTSPADNTSLSPSDRILSQLSRQRPVAGLGYLFRTANKIIKKQLDCEEIWRQYVHQSHIHGESGKPEDRRKIRINVEFIDERPSLDSVKSMDDLEQHAESRIKEDPAKILEVAHKLIASCFYFDTAGRTPRKTTAGHYQFKGRIRCRFGDHTHDLRGLGTILQRYISTEFTPFFLLKHTYGSSKEKVSRMSLSSDTIKTMTHEGIFDFSKEIIIEPIDQSSETHICLCLYPEDSHYSYGTDVSSKFPRYPLPISGFPRELGMREIFSPSNSEDDDDADEGEGKNDALDKELEKLTKDKDSPKSTRSSATFERMTPPTKLKQTLNQKGASRLHVLKPRGSEISVESEASSTRATLWRGSPDIDSVNWSEPTLRSEAGTINASSGPWVEDDASNSDEDSEMGYDASTSSEMQDEDDEEDDREGG